LHLSAPSTNPFIAAQFPWPALPGSDEAPVWTGDGFNLAGRRLAVLSYATGQSGWTDDLTSFHEDTAGSNHPIDRASREVALAGLQHLVSEVPVILEVGSSSGFLLRLGRERLPRAQWIGSDYVRTPLEKLSSELPAVPLLHFDLLHCPLPDNSVDAVVLLNVLEHIEHDDAALRQVFRILRPGGVAVIEVPAGPALYDIYDELLMHFRRYTKHGLEQLVRAAGFDVLTSSHLGAFLYPPFYAVKQWNKRHAARKETVQREVVGEEIRSTASSKVLAGLLAVELQLGKRVSWPFGIRCVLTCRKPWRANA
jgi:SAM-dependent methyltransferase